MKNSKILSLLIAISPLLLFFVIFIGCGIYLSMKSEDQAFYQVSAAVAILPAIILAFLLNKTPLQKGMDIFLEGGRDKNIIVMCLIYLLAGAFATVLQSIGGVTSIVHLVLNCVSAEIAVPALFLVAALVSTAIGTSMGTIAAIGPIGAGIAAATGVPLPLTMGAIVGGSMFGDNLSIISDTSIAATQLHGCTPMEKFRSNILIAIPTMILTLILLTICTYNLEGIKVLPQHDYQLIHCIPYLAVLGLALSGINVFLVLLSGIVIAGIIGIFSLPDYSLLSFSKNIFEGYKSMTEIMILSLLIGGLGALIKYQGGFAKIAEIFTKPRNKNSKNSNNQSLPIAEERKTNSRAESAIAAIVSLTDICTANNTVSIILTGDAVREIAKENNLKPARVATLVDLFSCVFQGLIPYGAQLLMAGALAGISPLSIIPYVHYCIILGMAGIYAIFLPNELKFMKKWSFLKKTGNI